MKNSLFKCSFILLLAVLLFACDDDKEPSYKSVEIPRQAGMFLEQYFPGIEVIEAVDTQETPPYKITLDGNTTVYFDENWIFDNMKSETELPASALKLIDPNTLELLAVKEPQSKIRTLYNYAWSGGIESIFQLSNGNVYVDCYAWWSKGLGVIFATGAIPAPIRDVLVRNKLDTKDSNVIHINTGTEELYRVDFGVFSKLYFDKSGNLLYGADHTSQESGSILTHLPTNELPEATVSTINQLTEGNMKLIDIHIYPDGFYGIVISGEEGSSYLIDGAGKVVEAPDSRAKELSDKYFQIDEKSRDLWFSLYDYTFSYTYQNRDIAVELNMGTVDWKQVWAHYPAHSDVFLALPDAFLKDELPAKIYEYTQTLTDAQVCSVKREKGKYTIILTNKKSIEFDANGNIYK